MSGAVKSVARGLFNSSGLTAGLRFWNRKGVRILMYHRFPGVSELAAQCEHLAKHYRPVSLSEAIESLQRGQARGALVFTIDDGYRDFLVNAHAVLKAYSIPALVYLCTDLPDRGSWLWTDQVTHHFRSQGDAEAGLSIKERLKKVPDAERRAYLDTVTGLQTVPPPNFAPLSWDEIRQLAAEGVEFGAHTRTHPILIRLPDRERMREEIGGSKTRIEEETGKPVSHFCYPNGMPGDYNSDVVEVVRGCGFKTAVTGVRGINFSGADPFLLRRLHQEPVRPVDEFAHQVAGLYRS